MLLNGLWADMLSGVLQRLAPQYVQEMLCVYLDARDVVPIPDFITAMRVVSLDVGRRCPFGIRAVRVAQPGAADAASGHLVLDVDVEVLSSDADVTIHALVNDLVAPALARLGLRRQDDSFVAIHVTDVRLRGTLRVRLAPGARLAAVAFRQQPRVDLGLALAYHSKLGFEQRVPLSALPGVAPMMELLVRTEVAEYAVWPRFFAVDLAPPALLGLPLAPPAGAQGRLRVTLLGARGVGLPQLAAATEAADAAAARAAAAAEAKGGDAAAAAAAAPGPKPIVPFAVFRWSTGLHAHRTGPADAPLSADGATQWAAAPAPAEDASAADAAAEGECFSGDLFAPFGLDFLCIELRAPGLGRLGAAQVKLQSVATGETLFSFADAAADAFTALPRVIIGEPRAAYEARCGALLPGRADAPGVECSAALNAMDAWVPLDGQPGAALHLRLEVDWLRGAAPAGGAGGAGGALLGGLSGAVAKARAASAAQEHTLHVAVVAARGLPGAGTWAVAVGRAGDWQRARRTRPAKGAAPEWDDAFELRQAAEPPVVTLIQLRGALQSGPAETPAAAAALPSTQLRAGDAAAVWLTLQPLPGGAAAPVEVLLRTSLCVKM